MAARAVLVLSADGPGWLGVRQMLLTLESVAIVGDAARADEALALAGRRHPDVVISAATIGGISAVPVLASIRDLLPAAALVVLAPTFDEGELAALAALDLSGYLLWDDIDTATFRACLVAAVSGRVNVTSRAVARAYVAHQESRHVSLPPLAKELTPREREVLALVADGHTDAEIAARLGIKPSTVATHVARGSRKLHATNRAHLVALALRHGLLDG